MKILGLTLLFPVLLLLSCQKPPQEAIDAARAAYQGAAANPDTVTYAPDSLLAAQEKLSALSTELDAQQRKSSVLRRYDAVLSLAQEAQSAARKAASDAASAKAQTKADVEQLFTVLDASIPAFETRLWAAKRVRGIKLDADISTLAQTSRIAVDDARKDYEAGSFAAAKAKALTIRDRIQDGEARIAEAARLAKTH